jgi:TetR/AcrR family transcriptional regulator, regulator of autoinduction and epiphytic fitness
MNAAAESKRSYHAPDRAAGAERTHRTIVVAAKRAFEERGWAGTTLPAVADDAGVSVKTIEALFRTKGSLLKAVVDFSIRGDLDPTPMPERDVIAEIEAAADAAAMLGLHAAHIRAVNERSARVAWAVEHAAASDATAAELWRTMNENRRYGIRWATRTLLAKEGRDASLTPEGTEALFWVAFDWGTYRTLTTHAGMTPDGFEEWLSGYYRRVFLR